MIQNRDNELIVLLHSECELLDAAVNTLLRSVEKCNTIGIKRVYTFEEQESFDSLSSKFNRTSDLFTQKVLRTSWMLLHEPFVPFIDLMNTCEKMGIIIDANQMITIRDLRNQIAHQYIPEALFDLIPEVIEFTQLLVDNIITSKQFISKRKWLIIE
ncbi:MAG: hypothetical protein GZ091_18875 [Paludibacter sp.]|nr:hypothetical protein [Paludibacter sp.]